METVKTVRCKLEPTDEQRQSLHETLTRFAAACNQILAVSNEHNVRSKFKLQRLCYYEIKERFQLTANYVIRALARVASSFGTGKRVPESFSPTSADLDKDLIRFIERDETVSLATVNGREKIKLRLGNYQRHLLKGQRPTAGMLVWHRHSNAFYVNFVLSGEAPDIQPPTDALGVDLGIKRIATTSDGDATSGRQVNRRRDRYHRTRANLQRKGTRRAKRVLKRLSGKERRFQRDVNHGISKQLVAEASVSQRALAIEDLTGIRQRTHRKGRTHRHRMGRWAFYQLRQFLAYKAQAAGVRLMLVNPAYTSQTCSVCGHRGHRHGLRFTCSCGVLMDADINAARNIAALARQSIRAEVAVA